MAANNGRLKSGLAVRLEHEVVDINNSVYQRFGWYYYKNDKENGGTMNKQARVYKQRLTLTCFFNITKQLS